MRRLLNKKNTWVLPMVKLNEDEALVQRLREALKKNGGYCPCMPQKSIETVCMCKDFRDKIKDPQFEGLCHCGLYRKVKD